METIKQTSARRQASYEEGLINDLGIDVQDSIQKEEERKAKKEKRKREIEESSSYQQIKTIKIWMDEYYLDPIIGLIPIIGDFITQLFSLPFLNVSITKIKSVPLTLAIISNMLLDFLIGLIPYLGIVGDFFYKSHRKNFDLIVGFVEDDKEIIHKVNKKATLMALSIILFFVLISWMISVVVNTLSSIWGWFAG